MANNVLLFFWDEGEMGYSRKIKRCFIGGDWLLFCLKRSDIYQKNGLIRRVQVFFEYCCLTFAPTGINFPT